MTHAEETLLADWQKHREAPPAVRLEEDYDAMLAIIGLALNCPDDMQGETR